MVNKTLDTWYNHTNHFQLAYIPHQRLNFLDLGNAFSGNRVNVVKQLLRMPEGANYVSPERGFQIEHPWGNGRVTAESYTPPHHHYHYHRGEVRN